MRHVEIVNPVDGAWVAEPPVLQVLREIVGLPSAVTPRREERAAESVAALFRDHVQAHAARRCVGTYAARLIADFLVHRVVEVALHLPVGLKAVHHHPVHQDRVVRRLHPMCRHVGLLHGPRAADVRDVQIDADHELTEALDGPPARNRVEQVAAEHLRVDRTLDVHDGRLARHGQGLLQPAKPEVGVDGRGEARRQLESVPPERLEAGEREGDDVDAGTQVHDLVLARGVGDDRSRSFDEDVARRLHGHTRQDGAGRVLDDAGDGALRARCRGQHRDTEYDADRRCDSSTRHVLASLRSTFQIAAVRVPPVTYLVGQRAWCDEAERGIGHLHRAIEPT